MASPCICLDLRMAARRASAIYDAALAPLGVNIAQYSLLRAIANWQPVSLSDLGDRVDLDRSTVGRNTRVLERMGWVATSRGEDDQREALVSLTPRGQELMQRALPLWEACQQDLQTRLGPGTIGAIRSLLREL